MDISFFNLQRCFQLQLLDQQCEKAKKVLLKIQKAQEGLFIPQAGNYAIQQQLNERRQNG